MKKKSKKEKKIDLRLAQAYHNPSRAGAYGGIRPLVQSTGIAKGRVKQWLSHQDAYTLHKPVLYKFPRRRIIVNGIDHQWQADLMDMHNLRRYNDNNTFVLIVIDILSKHLWARILKNKTGSTLVEAFDDILKTSRRSPKKLQSDKGTEFTNRFFQHFLKEKGIHFFVSENDDIKCAVAERVIRTIKEKLWRYFTKTQTYRYVEVLPKIIKNYNHTYHRSIKLSPAEVNLENQEKVWKTLYMNDDSYFQQKRMSFLDIGDRVRISKTRVQFQKGYTASWTREKFTISQVKSETTPSTYHLKDDNGEELKGTFYLQELQLIEKDFPFQIQKILKERGECYSKEYLVEWKGYKPSFNSWIPQRVLDKYTKEHGKYKQ